MTTHDRLRTPQGGWVGPEELQDILADEGYSAGERKQYLKTLLTDLTADTPTEPHDGEDRRALADEVRCILEEEQDKHGNEPIAKDHL